MKLLEKLFPGDQLSKLERVNRTLAHQPVDRVALHDQLSFNPGVIANYTGKSIAGFNYTLEDICTVIQLTLDACFPPVAPRGTGRYIDEDGFIIQNDQWNVSIVSRPFNDLGGARGYLQKKTAQILNAPFDAEEEYRRYQHEMRSLQSRIGETVIIDYPVEVGFCTCWSRLGLELFTYLYADDSQIVSDYIEAVTATNIRRLHAIADAALVPVALIAEDFASKGGPIFSPALLRKEHFPRVRRLTEAWHAHGIKVIYHSDGNFKRVIPDLVDCKVDGFYCLEPALGMDIIELKKSWPNHTWAGGLDGVDLMERGDPLEVQRIVHRIIRETDALQTGGILIGSSSEINPPIKPANFKAMVDAVGELWNNSF
jgi:hypothetical protein